jgi:hypothetical protein
VEIFQTARLDVFVITLPSQISASSFMATELVSVFSAFCCQNLSRIRFRGRARELRKWNTLSSSRLPAESQIAESERLVRDEKATDIMYNSNVTTASSHVTYMGKSGWIS